MRAALLILAAASAEHLVVFHNIDGREIFVNPSQVTTLAEPRDDSKRGYSHKVNCAIGLTDGKIITVVENCETVRRKIDLGLERQ